MVLVLEKYEMGIRELLARHPFDIHPDKDQIHLFRTAFTHDSFAEEYNRKASRPIESYQRLEFLGDAVLEYLVCDEAYRIGMGDEGRMTNDFKQKAVANDRIAEYLEEADIDIRKYMLLGNAFHVPNGNEVTNDLRADVFEALVAAVYLTMGMECARRIVRSIITDPLEASFGKE